MKEPYPALKKEADANNGLSKSKAGSLSKSIGGPQVQPATRKAAVRPADPAKSSQKIGAVAALIIDTITTQA